MNATPNSSPTETPMPEKLASKWASLRLGHEAVMLEDARKTLQHSRHVVEEHHKNMGATTSPTPKADDMIVGDVVTNHYSTMQEPKAKTDGMSTLGKMALAGVAAAGLGSSVTVPLVAYQLLKDDPATIVQPVDHVDTDTQYGLRIYRGEGGEQ